MTRRSDAAGEPIPQNAADWFARMRGPTADRDRDAFAVWLTQDPRHAEDYNRLERKWDQSAFLAHSALGKDRDLTRAVVRTTRTPVPVWLTAGMAASLIAAITITLAVRQSGAPPPAVPPTIIANSDAALRRLRLDDRSTILLDRGAAVTVMFSSKERRVRLVRGNARFAVAHDARRPFSVAAGTGSIVARGTDFAVRLNPQMVQVTVFSGQIEVCQRLPGAIAGRSRQLLQSGQQISFAPGQPLSAPSAAGDPAPPAAMITFEHTPLADAAARINRPEAITLVVEGSARALEISGAFQADDPLEFARAAAAMFDLQVIRRDRIVRLRPKREIVG